MRKTPDTSPATEPKKKKKLSLPQRLKRLAFAGILGASAGTAAIEADTHLTKGIFQDHLRSFITDPGYRESVGESLLKGEILRDASSLLHEARNQMNEAEATPESPEFVPTLHLLEKQPIQNEFLARYFNFYEIREVSGGKEGDPKRLVYIAEIDNPQIVNFNVGTDDAPAYDPWITEENIGPFVTIPTNSSDSEGSDRTHALYSAYKTEEGVKEYEDVVFSEQGRDTRVIRAGALVLFSDNGTNRLLVRDSRGFDLQVNDVTPDGTVLAIESFGAAIFSDHQQEDIESMRQLVGKAKIPEFRRKNYNAILVTYVFEQGPPKTYGVGIYTDTRSLTEGQAPWPSEEQLTPQDFYSVALQFGEESNAISTNVLFSDPGPSSTLYDPEMAMGDVTNTYHSRLAIRPEYSLVQKGVG